MIFISEREIFASSNTFSKTPNILFAWSLAATSGTTHFVSLCSRICDLVVIAISPRPRKTAMEVSSQEVSKARRIILFLYYKFDIIRIIGDSRQPKWRESDFYARDIIIIQKKGFCFFRRGICNQILEFLGEIIRHVFEVVRDGCVQFRRCFHGKTGIDAFGDDIGNTEALIIHSYKLFCTEKESFIENSFEVKEGGTSIIDIGTNFYFSVNGYLIIFISDFRSLAKKEIAQSIDDILIDGEYGIVFAVFRVGFFDKVFHGFQSFALQFLRKNILEARHFLIG